MLFAAIRVFLQKPIAFFHQNFLLGFATVLNASKSYFAITPQNSFVYWNIILNKKILKFVNVHTFHWTEQRNVKYHSRWQICQPEEIMIFNKNPLSTLPPFPPQKKKLADWFSNAFFQACFDRQSNFDMGIVFPPEYI